MLDALPAVLPDTLTAIQVIVAGVLLGSLFYGGLWWTVRRAASFRHPGPAVLASVLLRTAVTLVGFYLVAGGNAARMLLCLLGFLLARVAVTRWTRHAAQP